MAFVYRNPTLLTLEIDVLKAKIQDPGNDNGVEWSLGPDAAEELLVLLNHQDAAAALKKYVRFLSSILFDRLLSYSSRIRCVNVETS